MNTNDVKISYLFAVPDQMAYDRLYSKLNPVVESTNGTIQPIKVEEHLGLELIVNLPEGTSLDNLDVLHERVKAKGKLVGCRIECENPDLQKQYDETNPLFLQNC